MADSDPRQRLDRIPPSIDAVTSSRLTRRSLLRRSAALGLSAPVLGGLLAACQQAGPSVTATAPASAAPVRGGRIVVAMDAEPDFMNRLFTIRGGSIFSYAAMTDPMFDATIDGTYVPMLAADVPTVQNGMVSKDSLTVTYKLKPNLKWSDGKPLTTDDLEFTWKVYVDPESDATGRDPYRLIESLRKVDAQTVEVKMTKPNTDYLALWEILLPKHLYDSTAVKRTHAIPLDKQSCHTGLVNGYIVEGHAPPADVARMLAEKPDIRGIAVPGMPAGSPGMEGAWRDAYDVVTLPKSGTSTVWSRH